MPTPSLLSSENREKRKIALRHFFFLSFFLKSHETKTTTKKTQNLSLLHFRPRTPKKTRRRDFFNYFYDDYLVDFLIHQKSLEVFSTWLQEIFLSSSQKMGTMGKKTKNAKNEEICSANQNAPCFSLSLSTRPRKKLASLVFSSRAIFFFARAIFLGLGTRLGLIQSYRFTGCKSFAGKKLLKEEPD